MTRKEALNILDLPDNANKSQIRHAYSEKSKIYHAETHPEEFRRLHEAYKTALEQPDKNVHIFPTQTGFPADTDSTDFLNPAADIAHHMAPTATAKEPDSGTAIPHNDILDTLVHGRFSISHCLDITQLIYHKCRTEKAALANADAVALANADAVALANADAFTLINTGAIFGGILTGKGMVWQDPPADERLFFKVPWSVWKAQTWTTIICHPEFLRRQYTSAFLDELCFLLQEEELYNPEGIGRGFYFFLCIAYGFFHDRMNSEDRHLQEIEYFLHSHPKHREYVFHLHNQAMLQEAREYILFCKKALSLSAEKEIRDFLYAAEEKLWPTAAPLEMLTLRDGSWKEYEHAVSWKQFILRNLMDASGDRFAKGFADFLELQKSQKKYAEAFIDIVLSYIDISGATLSAGEYQPLSRRLSQFRQEYLNCDDWRDFICRPIFLQTIKAYILSQDSNRGTDNRDGYPSVRFVPYETWRQLRIWFNGTSPFLAEATVWLKSSFYFSEYEKRYQKERFWKATRVKEIFLDEILPIPRPDREKRKLLRLARKGIPADAAQIQSTFLRPLLTNEKLRIPFLTRLAYTMVHFRFLQYTPADNLPGGIFCFLKKEVILYQQKDNLVCRLSHEAFYDILSKYFDRIVYTWKPSKDDRKIYSEEFLDNACRNLYCYECFVHSDSAK